MGLKEEQLTAGLDAIAAVEPAMAAAIARHGYPAPRISPRGYATLLRAIVGQQISVAAADGVWRKLSALVGDINSPALVVDLSDDELRSGGLSRQKAGYVRSLARHLLDGALDFDALPADDEAAIVALTDVKGIGRWTAEVYLLFAEGRADVFPAGDLAVRVQLARIMGQEGASERDVRALAERWRPQRGAAAVFAWHCYLKD